MPKVGVTLLCYFLFEGILCRAADPGGDPKFHGTEIPAPPAANEKWTPPEKPKLLAEVTDLLFGLGMADPRGCEYRQIKVMTVSVWGNYDRGAWNTDGTVIQTHGWVLPTDGKSAQRFAVCWNGWVYPVLAVGDPCSVDEDVQKQLQPLDKKKNQNESFQRGLWTYMDAVGDQAALSYETPVPIKAILLMRIGKPELASSLWALAYKDPDIPTREPPKELKEAYGGLATTWLFSLYNRAICAQMRGDDNLALVSLRQLATVLPEIKKTDASFPAPSKPLEQNEEGPFDFLKEVPSYLADMERRVQEPPHQSALELGRSHFPDKMAWINALIADLEDVCAQQDGQPGWVRLEEAATVKALVQEGDDAVPPLLDCLEHDNRYTRSVHFWRDFAPYRTVLGVHEAAYTALTGILQTSFFDIRSTGQDLTNCGPEARAKVVAAIRAYWEKRKGTSVEDQWFITLADDNAKPEEWASAALNIAKSGQSLRSKTNPDVTGLLEKRLKTLSTQDIGDVFKQQAAPQIADALLTWAGPDAINAVREFCNAMTTRFTIEKYAQEGRTRQLISLTERLIGMGDQRILDDYAGWLKSVPPETVGDFQVILFWFKPLWENSDRPAMQEAASFIFTNKNSAWLRFMHDKGGSNEGQAMLRSPLIGVPSFRQMLLAGLADQTQAGESGYLAGNFWMVRYGFGENGSQIMSQLNPLDPLSKLAGYDTFRVCDLYAWGIGQAKAGLPVLQFYWPEEKRDEVVKQATETLQRYGERYRITATNPVQTNYAYGLDPFCASISFPKLDHVAKTDDVQKGLAIFSLPDEAKAKLWAMPKYPLNACWLAIKDSSQNMGHSDLTGRQWTTVGYETGHVWQAEEGFIDGKWQRYFGFAGGHYITRIPAEEIEFPSRWPWQELDRGFDSRLSSDGNHFKPPLHPGEAFPLTLKLRNRSGVDQNAPDTLYKSDTKSLAEGVEIHLYRKTVPSAGEIVKETGNQPNPKSLWQKVPRKAASPSFPLSATTHILAPTDELEVMSCDLGDFYDLSTAGEYYVEMTFDSEKLKFTGGTSNYIQFLIK